MSKVTSMLDAVVVGAGPNGLTAAVELARRGFSVAVFEARPTVGGGARTEELTLPGFRHDPCSAVHPLAAGSPVFKSMPLKRYGLEWLHPELPMAHPWDDGTAAVLARSVAETAASFGPRDAGRTAGSSRPTCGKWDTLARDFMQLPLTALPRDPVTLTRFGLTGLPPSTWLMRRFQDEKARGLFAGLVAHVMAPLGGFATGAVGLVFALAAHMRRLAHAPGRLAVHLRRPHRVPQGPRRRRPHRLRGQATRRPAARPRLRLRHLTHGPRPDHRLRRPLRPLPVRRERLQDRLRPGRPRTVDRRGSPPRRNRPDRPHRRGDRHRPAPGLHRHRARRALPHHRPAQPRRPLPCPRGQARVLGVRTCAERLAGRPHRGDRAPDRALRPGFRDRVLARATAGPPELAAHNANYVGGDIACGAASGLQLLLRPTLSLRPYATPHPAVFLCSSATPPGPGVHGMSGHNAAKAVWRRLRK